MRPAELFRYCPRCGRAAESVVGAQPFDCRACGLHYYFNPTVAVAALLLDAAGCALFIRRAKEPAQGKLAMPGGFVDFEESAEAALRREIREEVNLDLASIEFLCSQPNQYFYREVTYPVVDLFFIASTVAVDGAVALDGVESFCWLDPRRVSPDDLAFSSMRAALRYYQERPDQIAGL